MTRNDFYNNLRNYESLHTIKKKESELNRYEFYSNIEDSEYIQHHGIKGQKWGVRRYQNPDGSLTEEGRQRYLNPDGTLNDKAPAKVKRAYSLYNQQQTKKAAESGQLYQDDYVYDKQKQAEKLDRAKNNKMYDLDFVETIQNAEGLSDDDIHREYEAYLKNPWKYRQEFNVDGNGKITNSLSKNSAKPKEEKKTNFTQDEIKQLLSDETPSKDLKERAKSIIGPKATPEEESEFWKALAKEYEKGNIKGANSKPQKQKPSKEEKKEIRAAKKEVEKNLKGGILSNWALLNKAMDEVGLTAEDKKNMSASDWNAVNEKIKELRGSKK